MQEEPSRTDRNSFVQEADKWRRVLHQRTTAGRIPARWLLRWFYNLYRQDPEEHKVLSRVFSSIGELERLNDLDLLGQRGRNAALRVLQTGEPDSLRLDGALRLLDDLDQILVEYGDAAYLCRRGELAIYQEEGTTTLLTWVISMGGPICPKL